MNAPKFTPGPWEIDSIDADDGSRFKAYAVYSPDGKVLFDTLNSDAAEIHTDSDEDGYHRWDEVARVNLTLAQAAPELYEALVRIMPFVDDAEDVQKLFPDSACSAECREAVKLCRAALAKAVA